METYNVSAHWDAEANVWWARSDDVPGLVAEAKTHEALVSELRLLVPELLALNMPHKSETRFTLKIVSNQDEEVSYV